MNGSITKIIPPTIEELGGIKKTGDTMIGSLTIESRAYPNMFFRTAGATTANGSIELIDKNSSAATEIERGALNFRVFSFNPPTQQCSNKYEDYRLPEVNKNRTTNAQYNILTTKNLVKVSEGGTGANNAIDAQRNLLPVTIHHESNVTTGNRSDGSFILRKYGNFVNFQCLLIGSGSNRMVSNKLIPSGWRPIQNVWAPVSLSANNNLTGYGQININISGSITVYTSNTTDCEIKCNLWWPTTY